ncbi:MAG: alpha/beta fold hydrolase [Flavobacteriales bacterium]|nr:alpha/beta fold hydrolase [Flavobacteriales bacterium]
MVLHSKIYGDSDSHLLIFHGLFGMSDNWATVAKQLSENFTVHTIDLRNHGRSFHSESMTYREMAEDIRNYMNYHKIHKADIVGHSLGGKVVMEFAFLYPEKLNKLVVVDIAPKAYAPHHQGIIKALKSIDFNVIKTRKQAEEVLKNYIREIGVIQFLLKNLYWREEEVLDFRFNLKAISESYSSLIEKPNINGICYNESLFLYGGKSDYVLKEDEIHIKKLFPNSSLIEISDSGHWIHADNREVFIKKVQIFLRG